MKQQDKFEDINIPAFINNTNINNNQREKQILMQSHKNELLKQIEDNKLKKIQEREKRHKDEILEEQRFNKQKEEYEQQRIELAKENQNRKIFIV